MLPSSTRCALATRPLLGVVSDTCRPGPPLRVVAPTTACCCCISTSGEGVSGTVIWMGLYGVLCATDSCARQETSMHADEGCMLLRSSLEDSDTGDC